MARTKFLGSHRRGLGFQRSRSLKLQKFEFCMRRSASVRCIRCHYLMGDLAVIGECLGGTLPSLSRLGEGGAVNARRTFATLPLPGGQHHVSSPNAHLSGGVDRAFCGGMWANLGRCLNRHTRRRSRAVLERSKWPEVLSSVPFGPSSPRSRIQFAQRGSNEFLVGNVCDYHFQCWPDVGPPRCAGTAGLIPRNPACSSPPPSPTISAKMQSR